MCSHNTGFNNTKAQELKYNNLTNFMLGNHPTDPDAFTWNGNKEFTWSEIYEFLFDNKKEVVEGLSYWDLNNNKVPEIVRNILPYYKCVEFLNYSTTLAIGVKENVDIFLIDPNRFIAHRVMQSSMKKDAIYEYVNEEQNYDSYYTVRISVEKLRSEKGNCKVYSHQDGFNICVQVQNLKKVLLILKILLRITFSKYLQL